MKRILLFLILFVSFNVVRGQNLVSAEFKGSFSKQELIDNTQNLLIQNGISFYKIVYTTTDIKGQETNASGLLVIPDLEEVEMPLLSYQHGTTFSDDAVPSELGIYASFPFNFGGFGYVVAAQDYLGYGESSGFHPYVHADTEASSGIDMLFAVREFATQMNLSMNDQLFISGYSQGGHAAMAVHREIEQNFSNDFTVTASAPMSGPYSISGEMKKVMLSDEVFSFPSYLPNTILAFNEANNLFEKVEEYFKIPYSTFINQFYNGAISLQTLDDNLRLFLNTNVGGAIPKYMLQDSIIEAVINQPDHPLNIAQKENDVYDWVPQAPTRLFYCMADDQVIYRNSIVADSVMNLRGAPDVEAKDIDSELTHVDCAPPAGFETLLFFLEIRNQITSVEEFNDPGANILVYPNPSSDYIYLKNLPQKSLVQIIDTQGSVKLEVDSFNESEKIISLAGFSKGLHFIRIKSERFQITKKVFIK